MDEYSYFQNFSKSVIPPQEKHYIIGMVYCLISITGMLGNGFIIFAVLRHRSLQTSTNVFIVNLAVADFLTCAVLPLYVVSFWTYYFFPSLDILCAVATGLVRAFISASSFNLASISLNRLIIVIQARTVHQRLFGPIPTTIWVICLWIAALLLSFLPHFLGIGRIGYTFRPHQCGILPANPGSKTAHAIHAMGTYPLSFAVILVCYCWIYIYVRQHNQRMAKYRISQQPTVTAVSTKISPKKKKKNGGVSVKQLQITKNLFYILCAFVVCLSPQMICSFAGCVSVYTKTFVTLNSVINPTIYGINHPQFRRIFLRTFCGVEGEPSMNSTSPNNMPIATGALTNSRSCILQDTAM